MQIKLTFWLQISFGRLLCQKCGGDLKSENFNRKIVTMIAKDYFFCSMQPSNFSVKFTTESTLFISWGDLSQYNVFDLGFQCVNLVFRWQIKDKQARFHIIAFLNIKATLKTGKMALYCPEGSGTQQLTILHILDSLHILPICIF